jgi:hypothetical protein
VLVDLPLGIGVLAQHGQLIRPTAQCRSACCADEDGLPAYLETADEKNFGLYQSFGFEVKYIWQIPEGPMFLGMQRPGKTRH